jgi:hypothetical protein
LNKKFSRDRDFENNKTNENLGKENSRNQILKIQWKTSPID